LKPGCWCRRPSPGATAGFGASGVSILAATTLIWLLKGSFLQDPPVPGERISLEQFTGFASPRGLPPEQLGKNLEYDSSILDGWMDKIG
jgi:hypothetical protein